MGRQLGREAMVQLVARLIRGEGLELEQDHWLDLLDQSVPTPSGYFMDLIYYGDRHGLGDRPSAEQIVDLALAYRPIEL